MSKKLFENIRISEPKYKKTFPVEFAIAKGKVVFDNDENLINPSLILTVYPKQKVGEDWDNPQPYLMQIPSPQSYIFVQSNIPLVVYYSKGICRE